MPYIELQIARKNLTQAEVSQLSEGIAEIMSDILGKKRSLVAVSVETINPEHWYVSGRSVTEAQQTSAFVSARITRGTNTEDEKSRAIEAIFQLLTDVLGALAEATYIVLESLPSTDWGYSGMTQESRKAAVKRLDNGAIDAQHYLQKSRRLRSMVVFETFQRLLGRLWGSDLRWNDRTLLKLDGKSSCQE